MYTDLMCSWCNNDFTILTKEYKRQIKKGRMSFFCSLSCAAKKRNAERPDRRVLVEKICPHCKNKFTTLTGSKTSTFCSRSCASAGSVTEKRRSFQKGMGGMVKNLIPPEKTLLLREGWKYTELKLYLEFHNEPFEFEFRLDDYIFDLALPDKFIFVEFDGSYHSSKEQSEIDITKDIFAESNGWKVIKKKVQSNTVINPNALYPIIK